MQIKEARKRAGMTQLDLARSAGVTVAAICRYEKGIRTPSVKTAKKIGKVLSIPWFEVIDNKKAG